MVSDPVPALRGEPAPTNVAGFGDQMSGGMPYKPHRGDGLSYAARMELIERAKAALTKCPIPKKDGSECKAPLTVSGFCVGHGRSTYLSLRRLLRGAL